jgi:hypothetical protein
MAKKKITIINGVRIPRITPRIPAIHIQNTILAMPSPIVNRNLKRIVNILSII